MGSRCGSGLKAHVAGLTPASQCLPGCWLAWDWWTRRLQNCQLNWFGQDGTVGPQRVVLQIAARACVYFLGGVCRWRQFLLLQPPALLLGPGVLEPDLDHLEWQPQLCSDGFALQCVGVGVHLIARLQDGQLQARKVCARSAAGGVMEDAGFGRFWNPVWGN